MKQTTKQGEVRIIGGKWRSRKLRFPAIDGLRPTTDRIRETVFNWLAPTIVGSRCLDLFAGSGALGLEALSRGASFVAFFDQNPEIVRYLQQQLQLLEADNAIAYCAKIPLPEQSLKHALDSASATTTENITKFDIIFLDPPFEQNLVQPSCEWLEQAGYLAPTTYIYIETERTLDPIPVPPHWQLLRSKAAGRVAYHLYLRQISAI